MELSSYRRLAWGLVRIPLEGGEGPNLRSIRDPNSNSPIPPPDSLRGSDGEGELPKATKP